MDDSTPPVPRDLPWHGAGHGPGRTPWHTPWHRRDVLRAGALATASFALPGLLSGQSLNARRRISAYRSGYGYDVADADTVRALAMRAIEAAKSAGATYAEARVTRTVTQSYMGMSLFSDNEELALGVRTLVNGAWGFAASPYWDLEEAATLARSAVEQSIVNAKASPRHVDLGQYPVANGSWVTPIRIDPFKMPIEEKIDFVRSFQDELVMANRYGRRFGAAMQNMGMIRQERAVATSDGAYFTQTIHQSGGQFTVGVQNDDWRRPESAPPGESLPAKGLEFSGAGWELFLDAKLRDQIPQLAERADAMLTVPHRPVDVGRYDIVFSASAMASLVAATFGDATQLDRALGYEANAGGTSYLGPDPMAQLGKTTLGSSLLTVTGDRSMPGGLATVKWDDEGVEPESFPLVQGGVLHDYQTTREQAAWLAPWYQSQHRPVRSHGCAGARSALAIPMQFTPNLTLTPGAHAGGQDELIANTKRGLFFDGGSSTDYQSRSGFGYGLMREIVNGKLGAIIEGGAIVFDSGQIWKGLTALGGAGSHDVIGASGSKGQPGQRYSYSVSAVPGVITGIAVIDLKRGR